MSQIEIRVPKFECASGTDDLIIAAMKMLAPVKPFFPHTEKLPHASLVMRLLDEMDAPRRKDKMKAKAMSLCQAAECSRLGVFKEEFQNWCWVKFPGGTPFFLSFVLTKKQEGVVWIVDEVGKRKDRYTPFGCHMIYEGSEKQEEPKEVPLPPEQALKPPRSKKR